MSPERKCTGVLTVGQSENGFVKETAVWVDHSVLWCRERQGSRQTEGGQCRVCEISRTPGIRSESCKNLGGTGCGLLWERNWMGYKYQGVWVKGASLSSTYFLRPSFSVLNLTLLQLNTEVLYNTLKTSGGRRKPYTDLRIEEKEPVWRELSEWVSGIVDICSTINTTITSRD